MSRVLNDMRRKVFAVVILLTAAFLFLFWLANHYVFRELSTIEPPAWTRSAPCTTAGPTTWPTPTTRSS